MNSQPDTLTSQDVEQLLRLLPKYRVLLHNDDENSMDLVVICPKETAEFYRAGLESYGLTSTIEPE